MGKKEIESLLVKQPAWVLALMMFFITMVFAFFWDNEDPSKKLGSINIIAAIIYDIIMCFACYIICRIHPKSIWYTPVICTAPVLSSYFIMWPFGTHFTAIWIILGVGIVFSITGAIVGAIMGKRLTNPEK